MGIKRSDQVRYEMSELERVQACAPVVLALAQEDSVALEAAVASMKKLLGNQWTPTHALQLLSGRRAREAVDGATPEERTRLAGALQVAQAAAQGLGLAGRPER